MANTYIGFRSSDQLHQVTDGFIRRMQAGSTASEAVVVEQIITQFLEEALQAFFTRPAHMVGLPHRLNRIVALTTETIKRATRIVVHRSTKKMSLEQQRRAADYMDQIRIPAQDGRYWYVAFPADPALAALGRGLIAHCEAGRYEAARRDMVAYLHALTEEGVLWFFRKPMDLLNFGPMLSKLAELGMETTCKASHSVINKVIPHLNNAQVRDATHYLNAMLIDR